MSDIIQWCTKERDDALKSIEFWKQPGREIKAGEIGGELHNITAEHIRDLEKIVADMDRIIAAEKADPA